jgi:low temperature requirement protein LtrA
MADATSLNWGATFYRYNIAWVLILLNILIQYYLKYRESTAAAPWEKVNLQFFMLMLSAMIAVILVCMVVYKFTGLAITWLAMFTGILATVLGRKKLDLIAVDFPHLSERVMLYVVFTFGEMIIAISGYFKGEFNLNSFYYSFCAFLIVVGLFMSYGFFYDKLLDRDMSVNGNAYMLIHIFIIFALSSLTMSLEFMREPEIALIPKTIYLISSFVIYYIFLFMLAPFIQFSSGSVKDFKAFIILLIVFVVLMALTYNKPGISIAISVIMTFAVWYLEYRYWKNVIIPHSCEMIE